MSEPTGFRALCDERDAAPVNPEVTQLCCALRDWSVDLLMDQRERVADLLESLVQPEPPTDKEVAALKNDAECAEAEHCDLLARPEPQGPMAWMYRGEPYFDGERWRENWKVTLDEKVARFNSGNKEPVPLWGRPAIEPVPQGPTDEELIEPVRWILDDNVYDNHTGEIAQILSGLITRYGRPDTTEKQQ
jgi:hypothetical protein